MSRLAQTASAVLFLMVTSLALGQAIPETQNSDVRYLLARRAGQPEKNYYDLSRTARFVGPLLGGESIEDYKPSPQHYGADILTETTIRYGVYQAWKVRVVRMTDSKNFPASVRDAAYVLIYERNPDWRFAAKKYTVARTTNGGQKVTYTDFQDGREYTMEFSPDWPRPWTVYEVEVLNANAFMDIAQASKGPIKVPKQ